MDQFASSDSLGRFLTLADIAEVLNLSLDEAAELVISGELPAIRIGANSMWRIERHVFELYVEAKYEEARRLTLWSDSAFTDLPELSDRTIIRALNQDG